MRLISNPSYTHSREFIELFRRYSSNIFYKDFTQYNEELLVTVIYSVEKGKEFSLKSTELLWLTKFVYELKLNKQQVEEDYLPILKFYIRNKSKLNPIDTYKSISELNNHIESLSEDQELISEKDLDIFFEKDGWILCMPHTTEASCLLGKETDWCTARTKSQNLFLSYVGRYKEDIVLFYLIRIDGNTKKNPNDKLSVGFINGKPVFDKKHGGLTVNAKNDGFSIEDFGKILGKKLAKEMLIKMDEKSQSIKGKHPAKLEMEKIAKSVDKYLRKINEFKNEEMLLDFKEEIAKYPLNNEIAIILSSDKDEKVRKLLAQNKSITEKVQLILSEDKDEGVRGYLAENPSLTEKVQMKLSEDENEEVRKYLAQNKSLTEKVQLKFSDNKDEEVRRHLAENPSLTEKIQLKFSDNKNEKVRRNLAHNTSLTEKVQMKLSEDKDEWVKKHLAINPSITEKVQMVLSDDESEDVRRYLTGNPSLTEKVQLKFSDDKDEKIKKHFAHNKSLTEKVQMKLSDDENEEVRRSLALNTSLTEKVQMKLSEDENEEVRRYLAQNKSITKKVQIKLASDPSPYVRTNLYTNEILDKKIKKMIERSNTRMI